MHGYENLSEQYFAWAESYLQRFPNCSLTDLDYYWAPYLYESISRREINRLMGISSSLGVLISGPYGSGRHTTGMSLAGDLGKEEGFHFLWISGDEIAFEPKGTRARVHALFELTKKYGKICYLIDGMEGCEQAHSMMGWIADDAIETNGLAYLVVVCENDKKVNPRLRAILDICMLTLPNEEQRRIFFTQELEKGVRLPIIEELTLGYILECTEGFSYFQLNAFVRYLRMALLRKIQIDSRQVEEVMGYIKSHSIVIDWNDFYDCLDLVQPKVDTQTSSIPSISMQNMEEQPIYAKPMVMQNVMDYNQSGQVMMSSEEPSHVVLPNLNPEKSATDALLADLLNFD